MSTNLETHQILTVSTKHITLDENNELNIAARDSSGVMAGSYGFLVFVPSKPPPYDVTPVKGPPSEGFKACLQLARDNGCDYLMLDSDGPVIEGIPEYDW